MKKFPYLAPETEAMELFLDSGCMIGNSLLGNDTNPDMDFSDIDNPFGTMSIVL